MRLIAICVLLCLWGQEGLGIRILGLFPMPVKSHVTVTSPVMHALAKKGHDVTMFLPFHTDFNASNYKEIIYENILVTNQVNLLEYIRMSFVMQKFVLYNMGLVATEKAVKSPEAKALLESNEQFDIIVMEQFYTEAFFIYAHKFKCPVVLISTFGTTSSINRIFGNSEPYSYVPSAFVTFGDKMTFVERFLNTLANIFLDFTRKYYYMPKQQALVDKYFSDSGIDIPSIEEVERQSNFILINSHHAFSSPRPYMPNMKDVAGMNLKPVKPLPLDLQKYFDSSKNGVILFSLGSAMQSILVPDNILKTLQKAFERLPYDVLWKWENDTMVNKPKNVRIRKWLPQNDILTHPNLKLFVTHGGISSMIETVYHAVPIVGIPLFGDQTRNIISAKSKGYAELLHFENMREDEIYDTIMKVSTDPIYRENVKQVSAYWKDEMNHPLDAAVHWIEYVYKHNGAKHLKAAVTEQNFIQYFLLDVGFTILLILMLISFLVGKIFRMLCKKSDSKKISKKIQ